MSDFSKLSKDGYIAWTFKSGKTLKFKLVALGDLSATEVWARERCRAEMHATANQFTGTDRLQILRSGISPYDLQTRIDSIEGKLYMFYLTAKKFTPEITLEEIGDTVPMEDILPLTAAIYGYEDDEETSAIPPVTPEAVPEAG